MLHEVGLFMSRAVGWLAALFGGKFVVFYVFRVKRFSDCVQYTGKVEAVYWVRDMTQLLGGLWLVA